MRAKYIVLSCLSVMVWVLSSQSRSVALVHSRPHQPANLAEGAAARGVVFGLPGDDSTVRILSASERVSARFAAGALSGPPTRMLSGAPSGARAEQAGSGKGLPLVVDGATNPARIPDSVAYRHFLSITAVSATASDHERGRRDAALAQVQLSPEDRTAYIAAIVDVRKELTSIERRRRLVGQADAGALSYLRVEHARLLDDAATRAVASLSSDGAGRLRQHITSHVKSRIRIYGAVPR